MIWKYYSQHRFFSLNTWQWHSSLSNGNHQLCRQYSQNKNILRLRHISISKCTFMISRTIIIGASSVYRVALIQPRGSSLVVTHHTADVRVTSDRPITLGIVPVELSTSIYGIHAATYVDTCLLMLVNRYINSTCLLVSMLG